MTKCQKHKNGQDDKISRCRKCQHVKFRNVKTHQSVDIPKCQTCKQYQNIEYIENAQIAKRHKCQNTKVINNIKMIKCQNCRNV